MAVEISERGQKLRKSLERKFIRGDGNLGVTTTACIERARYWTESMRETEGQPQVLRRAKALANYLEKKTIFLYPNELLAGHLGKDINSVPFYMEFYTQPVLRECMASEFALTKEEWEELGELDKFWAGRTSEEQIISQMPEDIKEKIYPPTQGTWRNTYSTIYRYSGNSPGADLQMLWGLGVNGIQEKIKESLEKYDPGKCDASLTEDYVNRTNQLKAMLIASDAVKMFVERYAQMARDEAAKTDDPGLKEDLENMAAACNIAEPSKTFQQALQVAWFEHMLSRSLEMQAAGSPHRMDYLLYPFYKSDIEAGILTEEKARELLENFFLKYERVMGILTPANVTPSAVGSNMLFQHFTLGGVDPLSGRDSTNDLTYMFLDTSKVLGTVQPALSIRCHAGTPDELLAKGFDCLKSGSGGNPSFFGDKAVIEHLLDRGVSMYDARNNCVAGCVAVCIEGKNILTQLKVAGSINVPWLLSVTLNDGLDIMSGEQVGPQTGKATELNSYEDVVEAFRQQLIERFTWGYRGSMIARRIDAQVNRLPWVSCLNEASIEQGKDGREIADHSYPFFGCVSGIVDVADALMVIRKLCFEDKKVSLETLVEACQANWEGFEDLRQMCLDAPKFGDDMEVAEILNDLYELFHDEAAKFKDYNGAKFDVQYHSVSTFLSYAAWTPALMNGRRKQEPLYDGGISPMAGHGGDPTTVLNSVAKIDASKTQRILHNMRLNPNTTPQQFIALMRTWIDLGLSQVQFNIFDVDTLRAAQKEPESYEDLLVRVAGFSAVFVNLAPFVQETVIARTEQDLATMC